VTFLSCADIFAGGNPLDDDVQHNPLNLIERVLILAAIVELRRPRALMRRYLLRVLEEAAVLLPSRRAMLSLTSVLVAITP
jgi:predicted transcriptional regulator